MLEKTTYMNALFDFYQELLTPKQKEYMELYYWEDYSLGDISDEVAVSRQAVYDNLRRTENVLQSYEERLQLYGTFRKRQELLDILEDHAVDRNDSKALQYINELRELE